MNPEDMSGGVPELGTTECKIWVQRQQPKHFVAAMEYEGSWAANLRGVEGFLQDGYRIVSHTFTLLEDDGSGVVTCILVR